MIKLFFPDAGRQMKNALKQYQAASKKDAPDILNAEGLNTARETMKRIPKAASSKIKADMGTPKKPSRLAIRLAVKALPPGSTKKQIMEKAGQIVRARLRSIAYIKAGQIPIIKAFGGAGREPNPKSKAAKSTGKKASSSQYNPTAELSNKATGAGKVGAAALEGALVFRAGRLEVSAQKRMRKTAKRFSGK